MTKFTVGQRVLILPHAFGDSTEESDTNMRGKVGEIWADMEQQLGSQWRDSWEVGMPDGEWAYLNSDELLAQD